MEEAMNKIPVQTNHKYDYKMKDYLKTALGQATVFDEYVNRPSHVSRDFGNALNYFYSKNPSVSRNPAEWPADKRQLYEQEILDYYGPNRDMTNATKRYNRMKGNLLNK
ncbi:unnamed protein product [Didymodactylos carnosus]|uniref:Uncharacterized protein n=1 Tax=Didymodactylos carnosus TaxID=1234261 RepID=A0A8S2YH81_9BILA|nr:unnamed protein product [Didymodactylos carnosus]CAF4562204.1 unnamed protein product [Didymodactylos carnosus]